MQIYLNLKYYELWHTVYYGLITYDIILLIRYYNIIVHISGVSRALEGCVLSLPKKNSGYYTGTYAIHLNILEIFILTSPSGPIIPLILLWKYFTACVITYNIFDSSENVTFFEIRRI